MYIYLSIYLSIYLYIYMVCNSTFFRCFTYIQFLILCRHNYNEDSIKYCCFCIGVSLACAHSLGDQTSILTSEKLWIYH